MLSVAVILLLRGHLLNSGTNIISQGTALYQGALWSFNIEDEGGPACIDGTLSGRCNSQFQYCKRGTLISNCSRYCGCPTGSECVDGECTHVENQPDPSCPYYKPIWKNEECACNETSCGSSSSCENNECTLRCNDGTPLGLCSLTRPLYCQTENQQPIPNCERCGCLEGYICHNNECKETCSDNTIINTCNDKNQYCNENKQLIQCNENETCTENGCECKENTCYDNKYCNNGEWTECNGVCNNGHCCPSERPVWNGSACVECTPENTDACTGDCSADLECCPSETPVWDGSACVVCQQGQCYDNKICTNGQLTEECGECGFTGCLTSGKYCDGADEIDNCTCSGCGENQACNETTGECYGICIDSGKTIPVGECSQNDQYCTSPGNLIENCTCGGCEDGKSCDAETGICWNKRNLIDDNWQLTDRPEGKSGDGWDEPTLTDGKLIFETPEDCINCYAYYEHDLNLNDYNNLRIKINVISNGNPEPDFGVCLVNTANTRFCYKRNNPMNCMDWDEGNYILYKNEMQERVDMPCKNQQEKLSGGISKVELFIIGTMHKQVNVTQFDVEWT